MFKFSNTDQCDFFIQTVGSNAGRPIKVKSSNCVGVEVDRELLVPDYFYFVVVSLFLTEKFKPHLKGSVIPFITQSDIALTIMNHFLGEWFII